MSVFNGEQITHYSFSLKSTKEYAVSKYECGVILNHQNIQSGICSCAKHGGTVFSAVSGSIKDLATVPGSCNHLGPPNLMTFAPAFVFLSVLNVYSFAIEF